MWEIVIEFSFDEMDMWNLFYKVGKLGYVVLIVKDCFLFVE